MKFYMFHLMPWPYLPEDYDDKEKYPSSWVTLSNQYYDPEKGHKLYNRYLDELEYAETLGFDGVCLNEHHQNAYGTMPSPNLIAGMLSRRTNRMKIAIVGNGLPLRDHPLRVAEEMAMLDVVTNGRMISGFVRGIGCEYHSMGINPSYSQERFYEAHDLIIRAWTEVGPFSFEGKHYRVRYANVWPRPIQKPHPPIWVPGAGSKETAEWCAHPSRKYPYLATYAPHHLAKMFFDQYRAAARNYGYEASPYQMGHLMPVYVSDTDSKAEEEAAPYMSWLFNRGLRYGFEFVFPPGYISIPSLRNSLKFAKDLDWANLSFRTLNDQGYCVVGSAETVRQRLSDFAKDLGFALMMPLLQIADMPYDRTIRNMDLFATKVMPQLKEEFSDIHDSGRPAANADA